MKVNLDRNTLNAEIFTAGYRKWLAGWLVEVPGVNEAPLVFRGAIVSSPSTTRSSSKSSNLTENGFLPPYNLQQAAWYHGPPPPPPRGPPHLSEIGSVRAGRRWHGRFAPLAKKLLFHSVTSGRQRVSDEDGSQSFEQNLCRPHKKRNNPFAIFTNGKQSHCSGWDKIPLQIFVNK